MKTRLGCGIASKHSRFYLHLLAPAAFSVLSAQTSFYPTKYFWCNTPVQNTKNAYRSAKNKSGIGTIQLDTFATIVGHYSYCKYLNTSKSVIYNHREVSPTL